MLHNLKTLVREGVWPLSCKPAQGEGRQAHLLLLEGRQAKMDTTLCIQHLYQQWNANYLEGSLSALQGRMGNLTLQLFWAVSVIHRASQILKCRPGNSALIHGLDCQIEIVSQIGWEKKSHWGQTAVLSKLVRFVVPRSMALKTMTLSMKRATQFPPLTSADHSGSSRVGMTCVPSSELQACLPAPWSPNISFFQGTTSHLDNSFTHLCDSRTLISLQRSRLIPFSILMLILFSAMHLIL